MSIGHRHIGAVDRSRERELTALLDQPWFAAAVAAYKREDDSHDIPFAGGSNNAGNTVFWDRRLAQYVAAGRFRVAGKPADPRPVAKTHEAIEGAILRNWDHVSQFLGWPKRPPDYTVAHDIATLAEWHAASHLGVNWNEYQRAWQQVLPSIEHEKATNPPPNLLKVPYQGTPQAAEVGAGAPQKLPHKSVQYSKGHASGDHCGVCRHYQPSNPPYCEIVADPMNLGAMGWCNKFAKKGTITVPHSHPILRSARKAKDGKFYVPDPNRAGKFMMVT